jgi:hypothetical protein
MEIIDMWNCAKKVLVGTLASTFYLSCAYAQTTTGFSASAEANVAHDDNIYRTTDNTAISDAFISLAPEIKATGSLGKHKFEVSYNGNYAKYIDVSDADYDDHTFKARLEFDHSLRFKSRFEAAYISEHQEPGTINIVQLDIVEYNLYDEVWFDAQFTYGRTNSKGRAQFAYRKNKRDYKNNGLDFLDNTGDRLNAKFSYRIAPKTSVYVEAIYAMLEYSPPAGFVDIDNVDTRYRTGLSWEFTNKLVGDVNIGFQNRDFDSDLLQDFDGLSYDANIEWSITSFSKLSFTARRESLDSTLENTGNLLRTSFATNLQHEITKRLKLEANIGFYEEDFSLSFQRVDERYRASLETNYQVNRLISLSAGYSYVKRDSTLAAARYAANIVSLGITADIF